MGTSSLTMPAIQQAAQSIPPASQQRTNMVGQPVTGGASMFGGNSQPTGFATMAQPSAQAGGKGIQPPSPQALSKGLERQAIMQAAVQAGKGGQPPAPQGQLPMSMQRQPQNGMAGRTISRMPVQPMSRF